MKIEKFANVNVNKNIGKRIIRNVPLTKVCMFYEFSETILFFGLRYLHLELLQFLHRYPSLHVQFCLYVFQANIPPPPSPSPGRQCPSFDMYLETI